MVDLTIEVVGESLSLLPERAIYWPREHTLIIADTHFGKAATFRAYAIPLPEGNLAADLKRLTAALMRTGVSRLVVLGDLLHAAQGQDDITLSTFAAWRKEHARLSITLVRGNHDQRAGDPPAGWRIDVLDGPIMVPPFLLTHQPTDQGSQYAFSGHLHPGITLEGKGRQMLRLPCFWFRHRGGVLPAFASFSGLFSIQRESGDRVFALTGERVIEV